MSKRENKRAGTLLRTNLVGNCALWQLSFETASGAAPDGASPAGQVTLASTASAGKMTVTFNNGVIPKAVHWASAQIREADANLTAKVTDYTSAGVLTVCVYSSGAQVSTNNKTIDLLMFVDTSYLATNG